MSAFITAEAGEPAGENAAREELAKFALDEERQRVAGGPPFLEEALEVLAEDAMEHSVLGLPRLVSVRDARLRAADFRLFGVASRLHEAE